ncbi:MAG: TonB-dependent receptor plug domain-containing protein, partial [Acidobacteriota bacterium]
ASAQMQTSVESKAVTQLPLQGGALALAGTAPGVTPVSVRNPFLGLGSYNANGGRGRANNITIDNANASDVSTTGGTGIGTVPLDGIKEVSLISNNFSAEYGRNGSSQYQILTKSGTNEFHGRLFEFFRNDKLNARDYFDRTGRAPTLRDNQWGAAIGGRIIRDKLFYFGTYEQQKIRGAGGTRVAVVPNNAQVAGITNPAARALWQATQGVASDSGTVSNPAPLGTNSIAYSGKIDYNMTSKDTIWGRYAYQDVESRSPGLTFISSNLPVNGASSTNKPQSITLSYTRVFSPTLVLNQLGGFLRSNPNFTPLANITAASVSFQNGLAELGSWSGLPQGRTQNVYNSLTTVTKTSGSHTFKGGYNFERIQANSVFDSNTRGSFTFASFEQFQIGNPVIYSQRFGGSIRGNRVSNQGAFFQDDWRVRRNLTLNLGVRVEIAGGVSEVNKLLSNLNLDRQAALGGAGTGALGTIEVTPSAFNTNYNWAPRFGFTWSPGDSGKWSVRGGYGWAYDFIFLNPITNLRFAPPFMYNFSTTDFTGANSLANLVAGTSPFQQTGRATVGNFGTTVRNFGGISPVDYAMQNPQTQQWSLNIERQLGNGFIGRIGYVGTKSNFLQRSRPINTVRPGLVVPATSIADENARINDYRAINAGLNAPPTGTTNRIDPRFTGVTIAESSANSNYHSFQAYAARTFRSGFGFTAAYTWSKSIDDVSDVLNVIATDTPSQQNPFNNRDNRAVSGFDVPHRVVFTHSYDLPKFANTNRFVRTLIGGWNLSGIFQMQSGNPINLLSGARLALPDPLLLGGG